MQHIHIYIYIFFFNIFIYYIRFPSGSVEKNLPVMEDTWEMWVRLLGQEDLLEKGDGTPLQYSCLGNSWTEEPGRLQSIGSQRALCTPLPVLKGVLCPFVPFGTLAVWLLSAIRDSKAT